MMRQPSSYPENPTSVHVIETHISWVFLTDRHAFKLKKPVKFDFLDFSTLELRKRACFDEVRLNRRLAPDVYIGVLPVTQDGSGRIALNGEGQPLDWVVQMRRLSAEKSLDHIIRSGRLTARDTLVTAKLLADIYSSLPPKAISPDNYLLVLDTHIRANGAALLDALAAECGASGEFNMLNCAF